MQCRHGYRCSSHGGGYRSGNAAVHILSMTAIIKKLLALAMAFTLALSLVGCGDYIVTFHRNLLPKEVKVTEYGIDGSSKVML